MSVCAGQVENYISIFNFRLFLVSRNGSNVRTVGRQKESKREKNSESRNFWLGGVLPSVTQRRQEYEKYLISLGDHSLIT